MTFESSKTRNGLCPDCWCPFNPTSPYGYCCGAVCHTKANCPNDPKYMKKKCCHCKEIKELTDFQKNRSEYDGLQAICKVCTSEYRKKTKRSWRIDNPERYRASQRVLQKAYRDRYPEKQKARQLAATHKDSIKKDHCETCNTKEGELHMHHTDYKQPLLVITLCEPCHYKEHHA